MITGLDHLVLLCTGITSGAADMQALLGLPPTWRSQDAAGGSENSEFRTGNTALELMAPIKGSPLSDTLANEGAGLKSLVFATDDIDAAHHLCLRRGLSPEAVIDGTGRDGITGQTRHWRRFRLGKTQTNGIRIFVIQRNAAPEPATLMPAAATHLDHLVISTPNPNRALALYGARLGLHLALDRTATEWDTRFLFFRTGGLTLEIVHRLSADADPAGPDTFYGLTWAVDDLSATHARLTASGVTVSSQRKGRKPGSSVFTAKSHHLGVPTLFIAHEAR